jgi:aspartate dehydrogenase
MDRLGSHRHPGRWDASQRIVPKDRFRRMKPCFDSPLAISPKSLEMTALPLVRLVENRAGPLII